MGGWWLDLRFGLRTLRSRPGFALAVVLMLALGIGVTTTIFSVFNAVLLQPLDYPDGERLVQVWESDARMGGRNTVSPANWADWHDRAESLESIAVYEFDPFTLTGEGEARRLVSARVSEGFFATLGVAPLSGRVLRDDEAQPGRDDVAVVSHRLWADSFGADPALVGRTLTLDGRPVTVVGVMPPTFAFPNRAVDLWVPDPLETGPEMRGRHFLYSIARLAPGVPLEQAQAEIDGIAAQLSRDFPGTNTDTTVELVPLHEQIVGMARPALQVLLGAVFLVLLIACGNVANLLLARGTGRQKELAVRTALGASRVCLVRQLLTETVVLALIAGALGLAVAHFSVNAFLRFTGGDVPRATEIAVDLPVLAFAMGVTLLTGIVCGLAPVLQSAQRDIGVTLKETGHATTATPRRRRAHATLVVGEVALAVLLLVGGALLLRSFVALRTVDPGFAADELLSFQVSLPPAKYSEGHRQADFFRRALERIAALEGVREVGATRGLPFAGSRSRSSFDIVGSPEQPGDLPRNADVRLVSPGFFGAMGIPLLRGRLIDDRDDADAVPAVVINKSMAERFWPGEDPIGRRIAPFNPPVECAIVGVVGDVLQESLSDEGAWSLYVPYAQRPHYKMSFVVRTAGEPTELVPAVRRAIAAIDPDQPIYSVVTMRDRLDRSISQERFSAALLSVFALAALGLALAGVYAVLSFAVGERTHEIGVRMAIGAGRRDVLQLIVRDGLRLCALGTGLGILAALAATRLIASMLYGITPTDPLVLATTAATVIVAGLVACLLPAFRAARVEPTTALRSE